MKDGSRKLNAIRSFPNPAGRGTRDRVAPARMREPEDLFVAPTNGHRMAPWTEVLLMNVVLSVLAVVVLGAPLLSALLGGTLGGAFMMVPLVMDRRRRRRG